LKENLIEVYKELLAGREKLTTPPFSSWMTLVMIQEDINTSSRSMQIATGHSETFLQQQSRVTLQLTTVACCRCWYSLDLQEASRCLQRVGHSKLVKLLSPTSSSHK